MVEVHELAVELAVDPGARRYDGDRRRLDSLVAERLLRPGVGMARRVARRERLRNRLVDRVPVVDAEGRERLEERALRVGERYSVLRPARPRKGRLDAREVELDDLGVGRRLARVVPEEVLLAVRLDERDAFLVAPGQAQVAQRLLVDGEEAARRAVLGRHVPDRRAVGERQAGEPFAEVLDELPDDARGAEHLGHREHEVGRGRALGQLAVQAEAHDLRHEHRDRLAEHRRLCLDPADAPAEHAEPVHHRGVRVGADERVGERPAVARLDHAGEELEVDLVADPGVRRDDLQRVEGALAPAEERVPLAVAAELELGVPPDREAAREVVDLHRVVDHELCRDERVDQARVAAERRHRVAHRGEVDDRGDAREVLEEDTRRRERDLARRLGPGVPGRHRLDVLLRHVHPVLAAEDVLEQHAERVRQARDVVARLERVEPEHLVARSADRERRARAEGVGVGHLVRSYSWHVAPLMAPA